MPSRCDVTQTLLDSKVIAIVRLKEQNQVADCIDSLVKGGIKCLEITSNTPGYLTELKAAIQHYPEILIGAGTITNTQKAQDAINAGAQFLVTPNTDRHIVELAHQFDIPVLMGAFTPTEINHAMQYGADIVKLFPAGVLSIDYYKSIRGPLSNIPMIAVGGIDLENASKWLKAGIDGIGLGACLSKSFEDIGQKDAHIQSIRQFLSTI
jgi:2-dehydro-3-deoxyphosphogluconate aldolase/(4S)-4-hydroxy-2-oxoglutarate aldolase